MALALAWPVADASASAALSARPVSSPDRAPALRSMKAPGTANKYDSQPADMDHYVCTVKDNGGVRINSSIPNHAFYVTATTLGGNAWQAPGNLWYAALTDERTKPKTTFVRSATTTLRHAGSRYGSTSTESDAVRAGWGAVKVRVRRDSVSG